MSTLMNPQPFPLHNSPMHSRYSPPARAGGKKRKAEDEHEPRPVDSDMDHQMGAAAPPFSQRTFKKPRSNVVQGRPLPLSRVLESVDASTVKNLLQTLCDRHPGLAKEVSELAPRPTATSAHETLRNYEAAYRAAFPYGGNATGDYAHNRVKQPLMELLDALSDYTPHFLPPNETQASVSLTFLDGATDIIHRLPDWDNPIHNHPKQMAYEEITKAWVLIISEAGKRAAGISLQYGGWVSKLAKHNENSGGRMEAAVIQMQETLGWAEVSNSGARSQRSGPGFGFGMHSGSGVPVRTW